MDSFVEGTARVTVPATSANLGPGFDSLGLALSLRDEISAQVTERGVSVEVTGVDADAVARDESHLVVRSMLATFDLMGTQPAGLALSCVNRIPHGRGLGSSSAAIVAGLFLARALVQGGTLLVDDDRLFQLATELEGHPDNVAPALYGGLVICGQEDGRFFAVSSTVDARVSAVVFVPPAALATSVARGLLPATVPHADAAANAGRAALLVSALAGRPAQLFTATRDYLHQDYRENAMPASLELMRALRADGVPAVISGAGPTVLAFRTGASGPGEPLLDRCPDGWAAQHLAVERFGVQVS